MLFDAHHTLVWKLARDVGIGKRDVIIEPRKIGVDEVTFVTATSEDGLEFLKEMMGMLPRASQYEDRDDEDDDELDDEEE